jgi:hypothetical protein
LEQLAFEAKDLLLVVDDFAPYGSAQEVQQLHATADRLFRGVGNQSGRQRLTTELTLRPTKPPRALVLATGEDPARGHSLRARVVALELEVGDIDWLQMSHCQQDAAAGQYASAMASFIAWVAPHRAALQQRLLDAMQAARHTAAQSSGAGADHHAPRTICANWRLASSCCSSTRWPAARSMTLRWSNLRPERRSPGTWLQRRSTRHKPVKIRPGVFSPC